MDWIWDLLKYKKTICDSVVYANTEKCLWLRRVFEYRKMFCGKQFFFERGQTVTKLPAVQTLVPAAAQADGLCLLRNFSGDVLLQHFCCRMVMVTEHPSITSRTADLWQSLASQEHQTFIWLPPGSCEWDYFGQQFVICSSRGREIQLNFAIKNYKMFYNSKSFESELYFWDAHFLSFIRDLILKRICFG